MNALAIRLLALTVAQTPPTLGTAIEQANAGEFGASWSTSARLSSELERAEGRVYVLAKSGQLRAALSEAERAIAAGLDDRWLLERSCALAISLREPEIASTRLEDLRRSVERVDATERDRWLPALREHETETAQLLEHRGQLQRALRRAWFCIAGAGMLATSLLVWSRRARF